MVNSLKANYYHTNLLSWIHTGAKSTWPLLHCNGHHGCNPLSLQPQTTCRTHAQSPPDQLGKPKRLQEAPQDGFSLPSPQPANDQKNTFMGGMDV